MTTSAGADDLDDGLEYNVSLSEDEGTALNTEEIKLSLGSADDNDEADEPSSGSKRKHKSSALKEKKRLKMETDMQAKKNLSKEVSPEIIADFVNSKISQKNPDLSSLELSELYFTKTDFRSTADFTDERTLNNLGDFILRRFKNMLPAGSKKSKKSQKSEEPKDQDERKFIAVLSMSALRACDVHRATRDLSGSSLKLINKNKLDVDLKLVKTTRSRVLCCTPGRLAKVLAAEESPLKKSEVKIVILDNSYLDKKLQNVWDIKETTEVLKELTLGGSKVYLY